MPRYSIYDPDSQPTDERVRTDLWPPSELPVRQLRARGGETILVDGDYDGEYFAQYNWRYINSNKSDHFLTAYVGHREGKPKTIYLHRLVIGELLKPGNWVTFRNGNHLDCRSANIAQLSPAQNAAKRAIGSGIGQSNPGRAGFKGVNKTGYLGVDSYSWTNRDGSNHIRYRSQVAAVSAFSFRTAEEAARDYDRRATERWGEWAQLNFPRDHTKK